MAPFTLSDLPPSKFPQTVIDELLHDGVLVRVPDSWFARQIQKVDRILTEARLSTCEDEDERNPFGCSEPATVLDLASRREYCVKHFQAVNHGTR